MSTEVHTLLHQAACWRVAGLLFRRPTPARCAELMTLARETVDADLEQAARAAARTGEGLYHAWLGAGIGPLSPREVSYRPIEDPGRILAEIGAFHDAFAYRAGSEDPLDHVAVAADFVAYLLLKEAFAADAARDVDATTTREARERFLERHVHPLARGMAGRLAEVAPDVDRGHFELAVSLLGRLAGASIEPGASSDDEPFPLPGLEDDAFDCGACPHA